jgi:hypothetical protein
MDFAISCTLIIWIIICTLPATIWKKNWRFTL